MSSTKSLEASYRCSLTTSYVRTDNTISNDSVQGGIGYDISGTLINGGAVAGVDGAANLLYYKKYTIANGNTETLVFDDGTLLDIWGEGLVFAHIKQIVLHNVELVTSVNKKVTFAYGNEAGVITGSGFRVIGDPAKLGVGDTANNLTLLSSGSESVNVVCVVLGNDTVSS